ncbi:membrane-associated kinase regulator [Musa troglodytarum]|uniref:Membrane-associated kinase regulator n=1 Tax=Musa troglodytarum TaxID=320322 RepID=A0A9E7HS84_9LILI|nr:membrane-associated kinase regulator [Musa troglodytarum]
MERTRDGDGPTGSGGAPALSFFPSPSSSSSSDFEFTVSLSPSSKRSCSQLCPADELFYKGQLLPLHLSPRISMVRTLILASASASSSSTDTTTTTESRDSNGSSSSSAFSVADLILPECDSSRPSSVTEEDARRISPAKRPGGSKYLSSLATRFSSVFLHRGSKKLDPSADPSISIPAPPPPPPTKRANSSSSLSAKEVIKKCVKKVKPIYEKLSSLQQRHNQQQQPPPPPQHHQRKKTFSFSIKKERMLASSGKKNVLVDDRNNARGKGIGHSCSQSFSGNLLGHPTRKKQWAASCPSSMRSSPSHSGLLYMSGGGFPEPPPALSLSASSMEELQSAIQGAIAHCKSSMIQANRKKAPDLAGNEKEIDRS